MGLVKLVDSKFEFLIYVFCFCVPWQGLSGWIGGICMAVCQFVIWWASRYCRSSLLVFTYAEVMRLESFGVICWKDLNSPKWSRGRFDLKFGLTLDYTCGQNWCSKSNSNKLGFRCLNFSVSLLFQWCFDLFSLLLSCFCCIFCNYH